MAILSDIGKVASILYIPCTPSPQIWLKAFRPSVMKVFWSFVEPTTKQDIKLLTGKSWLKNLRQYVEIAGESETAFFDSSLTAMFEIAEVLDTAAWWFFIAEIAADGLANWTSLAYAMAGCNAASLDGTIAGIAPFDTLSSAGVWTPGPIWNQTRPSGGGSLASVFQTTPGVNSTLSATLTAKGLLDNKPAAISTRIINGGTGQVMTSSSIDSTSAAAGAATVVSAHLPTNSLQADTYEFQWRNDSTESIIVTADGRITFTTGAGGRDL